MEQWVWTQWRSLSNSDHSKVVIKNISGYIISNEIPGSGAKFSNNVPEVLPNKVTLFL